MFYNHDEELSFLDERYANLSAGELIVIYGRHRVGKTELVRKFISTI